MPTVAITFKLADERLAEFYKEAMNILLAHDGMLKEFGAYTSECKLLFTAGGVDSMLEIFSRLAKLIKKLGGEDIEYCDGDPGGLLAVDPNLLEAHPEVHEFLPNDMPCGITTGGGEPEWFMRLMDIAIVVIEIPVKVYNAFDWMKEKLGGRK